MSAPWLAPAIGAGAQLIGNYMSGQTGGNQDTQNWFNEVMATRQQNFQEKMANTTHQREVADLQAAGLNPTLSAGGGGAPSPGGASASAAGIHAPKMEMPNVLAAVSLHQEQQKIKIQEAATAEAIRKSQADRALTGKKTENEGKGIIKTLDQGGGDLLRYLLQKGKKELKPNQYYKPPGNNPPNMGPLIKGMQ